MYAIRSYYAEIEAKGPKSGKAPGIHLVEPDPVVFRQKLELGYRFVAYSLDFRMLDVACRVGKQVFDDYLKK